MEKAAPNLRPSGSGLNVCAAISIILLLLLTPCLWAGFLSSLSPNLRKFLSDHPTAWKAFTNAASGAFSGKTARVYYFYSDNPDERRPSHFYPDTAGMPDVVICVAQDSYPLDEFIGVVYETLNSRGEDRFRALSAKARAGTITRGDFAKEVEMVEFEALKSTRDLLRQVKLTKKEISKSHYYHYFFEMPDDFEGFLSYEEHLFPPGDPAMREYELSYDRLRRSEPKEPKPLGGANGGQPSSSETNRPSAAASPGR
jgi:hypothetical protein